MVKPSLWHHKCQLGLGQNGSHCYGFASFRMRFCDMYAVPAALAIAEAKRCRIRFVTPEVEFIYFMESLWRLCN